MTANLVLGEKFTVESAPTTARGSPSVTQLANGNIVMVFPSVTTADDDLNSVTAQIFTPDGIKIGPEIQLNATEAGIEDAPIVSALPGGGFITAWTSSDLSGASTNVFVRGQAFDAEGNKVGGERSYLTTTIFTEFSRDMAFLADGKLVVSWLDSSTQRMRAQVFGADGVALASSFVVASSVPLSSRAEIMTRDDGSFAILAVRADGLTYLNNYTAAGARVGVAVNLGSDYTGWTFEASPAGGMVAVGVVAAGGRQDIYVQRFAASGARIGDKVLVNDLDNTYNELPDVAVHADGSFTVAWRRPSYYVNSFGSTVDEGYGVTVQNFDASGAKVGGQSWLDRTGARPYAGVDIEALAGGGFFAGWYDPRYNAQDSDVTGIRARIFGPNHAPEITSGNGATAAYTVNENTTAVTLATASDANVNAKLVWSISGGADAGYFVINAQTGALHFRFAQDFENPNRTPNTFHVTIAVSDGYDVDTQDITVSIADVPEAIVWQGTYGADSVTGTPLDDTFTALGGNDTIIALGGSDSLNGGAGADTMYGGTGDDRYFVDNAGDLVIEDGNAGTDEVTATINYTLPANVEILTLSGGANLSATGNAQNNLIRGNAGANTIFALNGNDIVEGLAGNDVIYGAEGHDNLKGGSGNDTLLGGEGNDWLDGGSGIDAAAGGAGDDFYWIDNIADTVSEQADEGMDLVYANASFALGANVEDLVFNTSTNVVGTGNALDNKITASAGSDVLYGHGGNDRIYGNLGNDTLDGGTGDDWLDGGLGNDTYVIDSIGDVVVEVQDLGGGTDIVRTTISLGSLAANVENMVLDGTAGISGTGNALANVLTGNDGANVLSGLDGRDTLAGGAGNDRLYGGAHADKLTGGLGADSFVFDVLGASADRDTIYDFVGGTDRIELDRSVFTAFSTDAAGQISASAFFIGTAAASVDHHLIYNPATGALLYDADGKGGAAQIQIATLIGPPALAAGDIWLI